MRRLLPYLLIACWLPVDASAGPPIDVLIEPLPVDEPPLPPEEEMPEELPIAPGTIELVERRHRGAADASRRSLKYI